MRDTRELRLVDRIVDTPHLAQLVPRLRPELLHQVIQSCGLEDCGELVALATPEQLSQILDLDLWRASHPGDDEQFDAGRFGAWLEVLVELGAALAAQKLADMDVDLVIAGLAQHALVFDRAAATPYETTDGNVLAVIRGLEDRLTSGVGDYLLVARRADSWDAIVAVLMSLNTDHHDRFQQVMRGCRALSNTGAEVDGLHDLLGNADQMMFDLEFDREQRREKRGYVTPAQARAFFQMARDLRLSSATEPAANPISLAFLRGIGGATPLPGDEASPPTITDPEASRVSSDSADPAAGIVEVLVEAGLLPQRPRGLLSASPGSAPRLWRIQAQLMFLLDHDQAAYSTRQEELAFLANTIMAGCSIQTRRFTPQEASDAAVAVCSLGLENWPPGWLAAKPGRGSTVFDAGTELPDDFLADHDLVNVFQVGWKILYDNVCMYAAEQLVAVLRRVRCADRETQSDLNALRVEMTKCWRAGTPWRARDALDVIAILSLPTWAALLALTDEFPAMHAGIEALRGPGTLSVQASAVEFISENSQIASIRAFMESLPEALEL